MLTWLELYLLLSWSLIVIILTVVTMMKCGVVRFGNCPWRNVTPFAGNGHWKPPVCSICGTVQQNGATYVARCQRCGQNVCYNNRQCHQQHAQTCHGIGADMLNYNPPQQHENADLVRQFESMTIRSVSTQSQMSYNRNLVTPRFIPSKHDGAFPEATKFKQR